MRRWIGTFAPRFFYLFCCVLAVRLSFTLAATFLVHRFNVLLKSDTYRYRYVESQNIGGRCYDHNFLRFSTIFGEKNWRFSQKPML
jgi:hypothetical protein